MKQVVLGHRGSGKTTALINHANDMHRYGQNVIFITRKHGEGEWYHSHGLIPEIPVLSCDEYTINRMGNPQYEHANLFIDDVLYFLQGVLNNHIEGMSIDLEECEVLLRRDEL